MVEPGSQVVIVADGSDRGLVGRVTAVVGDCADVRFPGDCYSVPFYMHEFAEVGL